MRQSRHLSSTSASWPRSRSLRRLPSAPAAHGTFSTLFCESFLRCLSPYPGGSTECMCLVLPQRHRPSPNEKQVGFPRLSREHDFSRTPISGLQLFLYVQASEFACLPGRSYRYRFLCRAAEASTSEPNVHRYLCTHRICYPPDYRQLAERGLSPRKIHSIVDCSSHFWGSVHELNQNHAAFVKTTQSLRFQLMMSRKSRTTLRRFNMDFVGSRAAFLFLSDSYARFTPSCCAGGAGRIEHLASSADRKTGLAARASAVLRLFRLHQSD